MALSRIAFYASLARAKETQPPLWLYHDALPGDPGALGSQFVVVRKVGGGHKAKVVGLQNDVQGMIRSFPEAFLAPSVLVCEGATEVGLLRGLDQYSSSVGQPAPREWRKPGRCWRRF
jgi:hypothetical protein